MKLKDGNLNEIRFKSRCPTCYVDFYPAEEQHRCHEEALKPMTDYEKPLPMFARIPGVDPLPDFEYDPNPVDSEDFLKGKDMPIKRRKKKSLRELV